MSISVLIVDDESTIRLSLGNILKKKYEVLEAETGGDALDLIENHQPDIVLLDVRLPDINGLEVIKRAKGFAPETAVIMISAYADFELAIEAMKEGARDFFIKPVDLERLEMAIQRGLEWIKLLREKRVLEMRIAVNQPRQPLLGRTPQMTEIEKMIELCAQNPTTLVLITGESGTGKGLVAELIHSRSPRRNKIFQEVNCASLSETFLESELFGHERGAFTDAKTMKRGLLEVADGGTVFLDEIGDLSLSLQPKLLKVIETKKFKRIGGISDITVEVRIIAATNKDLEREMMKGRFREDLFYRINVMTMTLPALRERRPDIPFLAEAFVKQFNKVLGKNVTGYSAEAMNLLNSYDWPGNVRELKNIIERAMILCNGTTIETRHLPSSFQETALLSTEEAVMPKSLKEVEKEHIKKVLERLGNNKSKSARVLGLSRSTLLEKIKRYNL